MGVPGFQVERTVRLSRHRLRSTTRGCCTLELRRAGRCHQALRSELPFSLLAVLSAHDLISDLTADTSISNFSQALPEDLFVGVLAELYAAHLLMSSIKLPDGKNSAYC